jgi:DNA-binding IclR family transcriptional regulator
MASKAWLILANARLSASTSRVLYLMFYLMRDGNRIEVKQDALARDAGMHQPAVSAAIGELVDAEIIQRSAERGVYYLNPRIGFIGDSQSHADSIMRWDAFRHEAQTVAV